MNTSKIVSLFSVLLGLTVALTAQLPVSAVNEPDLVAQTTDTSTDPEAFRKLAEMRTNQNQFKEAVRLLERAVQLAPTNSQLQGNLGSAYARRINEVNFIHQGTIAGKMLAAFQKAVELDSNNLEGWTGLCNYYVHAPAIAGGDLNRAGDYAREIDKRNPFLGALNLGFVALRKKDFATAVAESKRAVSLDPTNPQAHFMLGEALEKSGAKAEAAKAYETVLKLDPEYSGAVAALERVTKSK